MLLKPLLLEQQLRGSPPPQLPLPAASMPGPVPPKDVLRPHAQQCAPTKTVYNGDFLHIVPYRTIAFLPTANTMYPYITDAIIFAVRYCSWYVSICPIYNLPTMFFLRSCIEG